jgi:hypothetical protein
LFGLKIDSIQLQGNELIGLLDITTLQIFDNYYIKKEVSNKMGDLKILEDVYAINGILIPLYNFYCFDKINFEKEVVLLVNSFRANNPSSKNFTSKSLLKYINEIGIENFNFENLQPAEIAKIATCLYCLDNKLVFKHKQLFGKYDWLSCEDLRELSNRIESVLCANRKYEVSYNNSIKANICSTNANIANISGTNICGRIDCISDDTVWEFKCTSKISHANILQLALYAYITCNLFDYKLFNILTGELKIIKASNANFEIIARKLIENKNIPCKDSEQIFANLHSSIKADLQKLSFAYRDGNKSTNAIDQIFLTLLFISESKKTYLPELAAKLNYPCDFAKVLSANLSKFAIFIYCLENDMQDCYERLLLTYSPITKNDAKKFMHSQK